jgi:hypothetical protein
MMYSQEELQGFAYEEDASTPDRPENVKPATWGHYKVREERVRAKGVRAEEEGRK